MNKTDDGALRAELERLQLDSEAAEERHAMEIRQMRIEHEELQVALHAANQRWRRAEQALADQSLALARIERERSKERIVQRGSQTWGKDAAPQSVSSVMGLDQLAHIGDDLRAAAGRRRAAKAAAARSLKQNAGAAKYSESTDRRLRSSAGTKLSPTTAPRQSKDGSQTLKRSLSSISSSMAIKQAETAAAVAALQIRSKAHAEKGAARPYSEELSPRIAWRGGGTSLNQTVEASRKDRIRDALQQTQVAAKKSLHRSLKARAKKLAQKATLATQQDNLRIHENQKNRSEKYTRIRGNISMTPPHKKTRKKKKKKRALFDRKDEDRVTAKATEAASGTDGDRRFIFVQYADEKQSGRQPAANVDKAEILLIEEEEEVVVESPRLTEKNSGEEEEDEDDVIEIVLDDDVDEKPADHGSEPRLVLLSVEEQLAMIEEEARQIQVSSQNFVVDPADRGFI